MTQRTPPKRRSPEAASLADPRFRQRIVRPRKGRASYTRKTRTNREERT